MKHLLLLILFAACGLCASAQTTYVTFRQSDGTEVSRPTKGLVLTFAEGQMQVKSEGADELTLPLETLESFHFSATATAIAQANADQTVGSGIKIIEGQLFVSGEAADARVEVYNIAGRRIPAGVHLDAGVYLVKIGNFSYKVLAR